MTTPATAPRRDDQSSPGTPSPLCDEETFAEILAEIVADEAPRLFAVVEEYGERADARIAAWGFAFPDHAELVSADRTCRMILARPENALLGFRSAEDHIDARIVWHDPARATALDEGDESDENDEHDEPGAA
ncbi:MULTISPECIES: hypothetical protein [Actinoalloteichus]|uniref:Uncharacterized protein n=1 Tax=Actinoalloteichus fjordicus TaxID=1612552 RepID=A0AAC9PRY4_9PSEU|nr:MULTISPECIES: hypothetical protein [Actinoalloteichus]APU14573.1 hypothetical protein UA74_12565 [Actinoalloteichus fjordicus]APU20541.1 hypothetical protein UA75_12645 [Actinoalloteichus sp. GBA129-24]